MPWLVHLPTSLRYPGPLLLCQAAHRHVYRNLRWAALTGIFPTLSVLNTGGEILRNQWKKNPDNKGKMYTGGFFKYSRHINYFGDLLWVTAYADITRNWYAVSIPVLLFCFFAFYNAPKLDKHLRDKYGKDYDDYASKTKMLIPFIY